MSQTSQTNLSYENVAEIPRNAADARLQELRFAMGLAVISETAHNAAAEAAGAFALGGETVEG